MTRQRRSKTRKNGLPALPQQSVSSAIAPTGTPSQMVQSGANPMDAMAQYIGMQPQQQQPRAGIKPTDVLIKPELIGRRPYRKYFIGSAVVMYNCMVVQLAQFFPVMRAFVAVSYLALIVLAVLDSVKQNNKRGYLDKRYLKQLGITYGVIAAFLILFHIFILYV